MPRLLYVLPAYLIIISSFIIFTHRSIPQTITLPTRSPSPSLTPSPSQPPTSTSSSSSSSPSVVNWYTHSWKTFRDPDLGLEFKYPPGAEPYTDSSKHSIDASFGGIGQLVITSVPLPTNTRSALEKVLIAEAGTAENGIGPDNLDDFEIRTYGGHIFYYQALPPWEGVYNLVYFLPIADQVVIFSTAGFVDQGKYQMSYEIYGTDDGYKKINQEEGKMLETEDFHLLLKLLLSTVKIAPH